MTKLLLSSAVEHALTRAGIEDIQCNVSLADISRWKIGGPADVIVRPRSTDEVATVLRLCRAENIPLFVLGHGSNMLFDSAGFRGVVMLVGDHMSDIRINGTHVESGAGLWVPYMGLMLSRAGLSGLEHTVGIPGTLGGLVLMNGGSQRKGIGQHVQRATCVLADGTIKEFSQEELGYSYRHSTLQGSGAVITKVELELEAGDPSAIRQEMIGILSSRRKKFPKNLPNCGSTFLSNPAMYETVGPPGKAIEEAGMKGVRIGGAQISPLHANFIVNCGGASSNDVLALIALIRNTVYERTGYKMDCEARFLTAQGEERPAHEFTDAGRFDRSLLAAFGDVYNA